MHIKQKLAILFGAGALVLFPVVRFIGWPVGDFRPPARSGWIVLLNPTKYPPSLAFPQGVPVGWTYFLCSRYARFKAQKAPDSLWRMF